MVLTINATGPACALCGCRPDDPMWVIAGGGERILCLGCVANVRLAGKMARIIRAVFFEREDARP